jgi:hypothetical protein
LLQKKVIVAAKINGVVEELVAIVVAVRVGRSDRASAGFVRLEEAVTILVVRTAGRKSPGHSFKLGHHLEHLDDLLRRVRCDDRSAPRSRNDESGSAELQQSFSHWGSRNSIASSQREFVQTVAGPKHTLGDFLFNDVAKPRSGVGRSH